MPRLAASTPLGLVLERQSSQAKYDFVESKKVSIVFRAELTAGDERAARLSPKTRTPPESALGGGVSGTLIWWCTKGFCYGIMLPAPRQKLPEISPIFKASTVRLHVSREMAPGLRRMGRSQGRSAGRLRASSQRVE